MQVARVDRRGLVVIAADNVAVTDVIGPSGAAVGLAGKGRAFARGLSCPGTAKAGGGK
jgi:hypothetical protein